jgi:hypothetical protein
MWRIYKRTQFHYGASHQKSAKFRQFFEIDLVFKCFLVSFTNTSPVKQRPISIENPGCTARANSACAEGMRRRLSNRTLVQLAVDERIYFDTAPLKKQYCLVEAENV